MDYLNDIEDTTPALYSRFLVLIYSICLTPIGGVILMVINLIKVRKLLNIVWLIIALLLFEIGHMGLMGYYGPSALTFFLPLCLGAILLAFPVWNILLKGTYFYKKRRALVPIIVLLLIWVPLMVLNFFDLKN
ncbi:hypothetical protein CLV59_10627 [Chitinophaga dinghuensis]|uniref:Uncharacterized protein n=1 Tax=Chitinophaga dinghuensis TaxID=1539050 RepID=A0A327VSE1_9BACT|nr:hypothetical protein CLV59_10627 [Chitinophaga dinghuensis]